MVSPSRPVRISLLAVLVLAPFALAQQPAPPKHVMSNLAAAKWGDAPPMLPAGAKIDVLAGNPMGATQYAMRIKFPANYMIPAHSHPTDENVTVLSGGLYVGMGDKLDTKAGHVLRVGGFAMMPAGMNHYAYTKGETIILLHGQGPVEFKYVNPADDPRAAK